MKARRGGITAVLTEALRHRGLRGFLLAAVLALATYTALGFLVVPPVAKWILTDSLSKDLKRKASVEEITFNPYTLSLRVRGLSVQEKDSSANFIDLEELHLDVQWESLFRRALVIEEITLRRPHMSLIRREGALFNFSDLVARGARSQEKGTGTGPPRLLVRGLRILDGRVDLWDQPLGQRHELTRIDLEIPFLSSLKGDEEPAVSASLSSYLNGSPLAIKATIRPFSRSMEMNLDLELSDLSLPRCLPYFPISTRMRLPSGSLDAKVKLSHSIGPDGKALITGGGDISLRSLEAADLSGRPLLSLPYGVVSVAEALPLVRKVHVSEVVLHSPQVYVERSPTGELNLRHLFPEGGRKAGERPTEPEPEGIALELDQFRVTQGKVIVSDLSLKRAFEANLRDLELTLEGFTTRGDTASTFAVSGTTDLDEGFKASGQLSLDPLRSEGMIEIKGLALSKYAPYYAEWVAFEVQEGRLGLEARYALSTASGPADLKATVRAGSLLDLRLRRQDEGEDFLKVSEISVKEAELNLQDRNLLVGEVATRGGFLAAARSKEGRLSLEGLLAAHPPVNGALRTGSGNAQSPPWDVTVKRLLLEDYALDLLDLMPADPVSIRVGKVRLSVQDLSTSPNTETKVSMSLLLSEKGSLMAQGEVSMEPMAADIRVDVKGVDLSPFRPYVPEDVTVRLKSGGISAKGRLTLSGSADRGLFVRYRGDLTSSSFACEEETSGDEFMRWKSLRAKEVDIALFPLSLDVGEISIEDFYSRIVIREDGTLNVQDVLAKGRESEKVEALRDTEEHRDPTTETATAQGSPTASLPIRIGKVLLKGGQIYFTDRTVRPHVEANMLEIEGTVSELSSDETKLSDLELTGKLEHQSPLEIAGKINPLRRGLFVDVKIRFKDIDLIRMNPYAQRYAGYKIRKGKLFLDLDYLIVDKKLDSKNRVLLDQLTLGERVESPDALNLPIKLAVAVLKNREGQIIVDLPVTGNIDDPQFDLGAVVGSALTGLLTKIVTAPFAFLGDLFKGEGETILVEFDRGSWKAGKQAEEKLKALAKALYERPEVEVELEGSADPEGDGTELRRSAVLEMLKRQKLAEMEKKDQPLPPIQDLQIAPQERERLLRAVYDAEMIREGKKEPPGILSRVGSVLPLVGKGGVYPPAGEMEAYLMGRVRVTNEDLRALALRRATAVKDLILVSGSVEPERIFLAEPAISGKAEGAEGRKGAVSLKMR